ncbi:MAG: winged helix-turn-helix transcriptional regulator [Acidobacteriia bacterium]|nr:winged helix-turn-helix transcriptional regulator [Terriglobia bacterium]
MGPLDYDEGASGFEDQHLSVNFQLKAVLLDGERLQLRRKEYELLELLVRHAGQALRRNELLLEVWGYNSAVRTRTLDVHIRRLRKKLTTYADCYIETIFGVGYRFQPTAAARFPETVVAREARVS